MWSTSMAICCNEKAFEWERNNRNLDTPGQVHNMHGPAMRSEAAAAEGNIKFCIAPTEDLRRQCIAAVLLPRTYEDGVAIRARWS